MKEAEEIEAIEKERAKLRKAATQMAGKDKEGKPVNASVVSNLTPPKEVGKTREKVAKQTGIGSARTYDTAKKLWSKANEAAIPEGGKFATFRWYWQNKRKGSTEQRGRQGGKSSYGKFAGTGVRRNPRKGRQANRHSDLSCERRTTAPLALSWTISRSPS